MSLYELLEVKSKMSLLQNRYGDLGVAWQLLEEWLVVRIAEAYRETMTSKAEDREA